MGGKWTIGDGLEDNWYIGDAGEQWPAQNVSGSSDALNDLASLNWNYTKMTDEKNVSGIISRAYHGMNISEPIEFAYEMLSKRWGKEETRKIFLENKSSIEKESHRRFSNKSFEDFLKDGKIK